MKFFPRKCKLSCYHKTPKTVIDNETNGRQIDDRIQSNPTQCRGTMSQVPLGNLFPLRHRCLFG